MSPQPRGKDFSESLVPQDQLAPPPGQDLSMPDTEAVLSEARPLDAPHNISPQTPALDTTLPEASLVESPVVSSVDNVTTQSILYRPLHSQITIFRREERYKKASLWRASNSIRPTLWTFRWPPLGYPPDLLSGTWATFSINAPSAPFLMGSIFRSSQDFHAGSIARRSAEKVLDSFKRDYTKPPLLNKSKEKTKVSFQASGPLAEYLHAPHLGISRKRTTSKLSSLHPDPAWS